MEITFVIEESIGNLVGCDDSNASKFFLIFDMKKIYLIDALVAKASSNTYKF